MLATVPRTTVTGSTHVSCPYIVIDIRDIVKKAKVIAGIDTIYGNCNVRAQHKFHAYLP